MVSGYEPAVAEHSVVNAPENFFTPKRLPGEPPWLLTEPPARFVAVRTLPRPVRGEVRSRRGPSEAYVVVRTSRFERISERICAPQ